MPAPDDLAEKVRREVRNAANRRRRASESHEKATEDLRRWFEAARHTRGVTISEMASLAGISRIRAYEIMDRR